MTSRARDRAGMLQSFGSRGRDRVRKATELNPVPRRGALTRFWAVVGLGAKSDGLERLVEQVLPFFGGEIVLKRLLRDWIRE